MTSVRQDFKDEMLEAKNAQGDAADVEETVDPEMQHTGSTVKEGLHSGSRRSAAYGRDEFPSRGDSAAYDNGRSEEGGRHYGRLGPEDPGPRYQKPTNPAEHGAGPERSPRDEGATHEQTSKRDKK